MKNESLIGKVLGSAPLRVLLGSSVALATVGCGDDPEPPAGVGTTYILNIAPESWEPAAVGTEVGEFVPPFLFKVESMEDGSAQLLIGTAENGSTQQACSPTATVTATGADVPSLSSGPNDVPIYIVNAGTAEAPIDPPVRVLSNMYDFTMNGVLPDGSGDETGTINVTMDIREIYPLFTQILNVNPDSVCEALSQLQVPCEPCRDGELYCLAMTASYLQAQEFPGDMAAIASAPAGCLN